MAYLEGGSIAALKRGPTEPILFVALQILAALDYSHARGIVHRDLNPHNVLLANHAQGICAKLADFGVAHTEEDDLTTLHQAGSLLGTIAYMSPEQASGQKAYPRSDLSSMGILLYELLSEGNYLCKPSFTRRKTELTALYKTREKGWRQGVHLVFVTGEAGIGKTHLVLQDAQLAQKAGGIAVTGSCCIGNAAPYQVWADLISGLLAQGERIQFQDQSITTLQTPEDTVSDEQMQVRTDERFDEIQTGSMPQLPAELWRLLPGREKLKGLTDEQKHDEPEQVRWRLRKALASYLVMVSEIKPLCLGLHNLQRADGDPMRTRPRILEAQAILRQTGDLYSELICESSLGHRLRFEGELVQAVDLLVKSHKRYEAQGIQDYSSRCALELAYAAFELGLAHKETPNPKLKILSILQRAERCS